VIELATDHWERTVGLVARTSGLDSRLTIKLLWALSRPATDIRTGIVKAVSPEIRVGLALMIPGPVVERTARPGVDLSWEDMDQAHAT